MSDTLLDEKQEVFFTYTNHRGETSRRHVMPQYFRWGPSEWHQPQWLLDAYDFDKKARRTFALADISDWTPRIQEAKT